MKNSVNDLKFIHNIEFLLGICLTLKYKEFISYIDGLSFGINGLQDPEKINNFINNNKILYENYS